MSAKNRKIYECEHCKKGYTRSNALRDHIETHNPNRTKNFVCQCGNSFFTKSSLTTHKAEQHGGATYSCTQCPKVFKRERYLAIHNKIHQTNRTRDFQCDQCTSTFCTKISLTQHKQQLHEEKRYACDSCNYVCVALWASYQRTKRYIQKKEILPVHSKAVQRYSKLEQY